MDEAPTFFYWRDAVADNPALFGSQAAFKHDLNTNRDAYRAAGVILEVQRGGTGERNRVLVSPPEYVRFWRNRTKANAV